LYFKQVLLAQTATPTDPPRSRQMQTKTYMRRRALDGELWRRTTLGLASDLERLKRRIAA